MGEGDCSVLISLFQHFERLRQEVSGPEFGLDLIDPPRPSALYVTPGNSIPFAYTGKAETHFSLLTTNGKVSDASRIVATIPDAGETIDTKTDPWSANFVVGKNLHDFLCLGCQWGYGALEYLALDWDRATRELSNGPDTGQLSGEDMAELERFRQALDLRPWAGIEPKLKNLQIGKQTSLQLVVGDLRSSDLFDWNEYENLLYESLEKAILQASEKYSDTEFYGMCLDCHAEHGDVFLHFNSEEDILSNNKTDWWDVGNWEYFHVLDELQKDDAFFDRLWGNKREYIEDKMAPLDREWADGEDPIEDFMIMVAKVAIRLKKSEAVKRLKRTSDFCIVSADHGESIEQGFDRMKTLDKSLAMESVRGLSAMPKSDTP